MYFGSFSLIWTWFFEHTLYTLFRVDLHEVNANFTFLFPRSTNHFKSKNPDLYPALNGYTDKRPGLLFVCKSIEKNSEVYSALLHLQYLFFFYHHLYLSLSCLVRPTSDGQLHPHIIFFSFYHVETRWKSDNIFFISPFVHLYNFFGSYLKVFCPSFFLLCSSVSSSSVFH